VNESLYRRIVHIVPIFSWSHLTYLEQTLKGIGYSLQVMGYLGTVGFVHAYANTSAYMTLYVLQRYSEQVSRSSS